MIKVRPSRSMSVTWGGHLDVTNRARAHTLSCKADKATVGVHLVSALPFRFLRLVGIVRSQFLPAGLHGCEGPPPPSHFHQENGFF